MSTTTLQNENKKTLVPELRFFGFDKDWEELKFGKLYSFQTTNSLSRDKLNYEEGKVYNIHYGDIHTKFQPHFYLRNENVPYINGDVDFSKIKAELYCKTGDIIIADASEDYADIGKSIELIDIDNAKILAGLHTLLARPISEKTFVGFTSYLLKSWTLRKQIMTIAQGTKVLSLSTGRVSNLELNIPTLPEQQKIASFLSAVDEKIQQLSRKKELLEQYKKGVMQQLFSGKLRFKDENGEDYADWEEKKLGEVAKFRRGSFPQPYGLPKWYDDENGMPFIQVYDVDHNMLLKKTTKSKISKLGAEQSVFVKKGTLVITIQGSIGRIAKTQYDAYVDRTLLIFQSYKLPTDVDYFKYVVFLLFEIEKTKAPGGTIKTITKEVLTDFLVPIPCLKEQQKIAAFLSSIDTKIESTNQQIIQTQNFKKGLLQQMFV